ncbi:MAG: two-component regulator propeller domain-containing protein [Pseudomonadota bacterium]
MRALLLQSLLVLLTLGALVPVERSYAENTAQESVWQPERRNIRFNHLDSRDGLSQAIVNSIEQGNHGFMWFGTQEGLTRFDGRRTVAYVADRKNPQALQQDWIWTLKNSSDGTLWIGTDGGGLARYRPKTDDFVTLLSDPANPATLSGNSVRSLHEDSDGILWVGTLESGLNRFDPSTGRFQRFRHDPEDPTSIPGDSVVSVVEDRTGTLWVGTANAGIARYNPEAGGFQRFAHDPARADTLSGNAVRHLSVDNTGRLWVGTYDSGLNLYDPTTETFRRFRAPDDDIEENELSEAEQAELEYRLPSDLVRDVLQDEMGTVWIATDEGLAQWLGEDRFITYRHNPEDRGSLSSNALTDLFVDVSGNLWVASYAGTNKWNYVSDLFTYYNNATGHLEQEMVTAFAEAPDGSLWIGTYGGGLTHIDRANQTVRQYRHDPTDSNAISNDRVMAVAVNADGNVYVGTRGGGLDYLDPVTGSVTHYRTAAQPDDTLPISTGLQSNGITSLLLDPDGTLWIGTYGGGLSRLRDERITTYRNDPDDPTSLSTDKIVSLQRDGQGDLWLGTEDGGVNRMMAGDRRFVHYRIDESNAESLQSDKAWLTFEDSRGNLWIGTTDAGLSRWSAMDRLAGKFRLTHFGKAQLQSSNSVLGIEEDTAGNLWISSNKGLTELNPSNNAIRRYDVQNGLSGDEFMMGVTHAGSDGKLYFGSATGLVSFKPSTTVAQSSEPNVAVTASSRNRVIARAFSNDVAPPAVELTYPYYALTFEFAALDFVSPDKNRFVYQLEGFEEEWLDPGAYPRATYTNLPAGEYRFRLRAANSGGVWNNDGVSVRVIIVPPPWKSRWAYASYVAAPLLLIGLIARAQRRKLEQSKAQQQELRAQVAERTEALQEQNQQLADLNEQLRQASVTDPLTGLRNRRFFYEVVRPTVASIDRHYSSGRDAAPRSVFIMMIDLDGFKGLNDQFGHHAGDTALSQLANLLTSTCRESDVVCRWGGDEFLILGEVASGSETETLADRIRERIESYAFDTGTEEEGHMTASIGICSYPIVARRPGVASWETVSQLADQAAYIAKTSGKNRWVRLQGTDRLNGLSTSEARNNAQQLVLEKKLTLISSAPVQLGRDPENSANGR